MLRLCSLAEDLYVFLVLLDFLEEEDAVVEVLRFERRASAVCSTPATMRTMSRSFVMRENDLRKCFIGKG